MGIPPAEHTAVSGHPCVPALSAGKDWEPWGQFLPLPLSLPILLHHSWRHVGLWAPLRGWAQGLGWRVDVSHSCLPWKPVPDPVTDPEPAMIQEVQKRAVVFPDSQPITPRHP